MARPTKQGIDYFPLDTEFDDDLQLLTAELGAEGLGILITIWQAIYKNHGYYIVYDKKFPLKIKQKCFSNVETIVNVVENAIDYGIFDKNMYENYHILTSRGIQKRYFTASRAKKQVEIVPEYTLVDVSGVENKVNVVGNGVNPVGNATKEKEKEEEKEFLTFYNAYPKHKDKQGAKKRWLQLIKEKELPELDVLLNAIERQKEEERNKKANNKFYPEWPYPAVWLNKKRWEDEIEETPRYT